MHCATWRWATAVGVLPAVAALLTSCATPAKSNDAPKPRKARAVPVSVAVVGSKDVPIEINTFGTVDALATVGVKAQVAGRLERVHFKKGQSVRKGDLLFALDQRPFKAALDQAQAALLQAVAGVKMGQAAVDTAQANLDRDTAQETFARRDAQREAELRQKGIASDSDVEKSQAAAAALAATVKADQAALRQAQAGLSYAQAGLSYAQAAVDNARLQLEYTQIRSPIDGLIGNLLVDEGNLVIANDTATTLATINQISPIQVFFSIPQADLPTLRSFLSKGALSVQAALPNEPERPEIGQVSFIDNQVDKNCGTVMVWATLANEQQRLWPGQYVNVTLVLTVRQNAVVVPAKAVQAGREGKYVFVVKSDDTAEMRPVTVGELADQDVVVEKGLQPGERVVTDGQFQLAPGTKVEIKPAVGAADPKRDVSLSAVGAPETGSLAASQRRALAFGSRLHTPAPASAICNPQSGAGAAS